MKTYVTIALLVIAVVWFAIFLDEIARDTAIEQAQISTESRSSMPQRRPIPTPTPKLFHDVTYKITTGDYGSQFIDVTYEMPGGTAQSTVCICKHAKTAVVDTLVGMSGQFVYLSAQNDETNSPIICEIYIDGSLTYQVKSHGAYKIASCSGRIP